MRFSLGLVAVAIVFVPAAASSAVVQFAAPARNLPTQHLHNAVYDAILPSGRIVTPAGQSVVSGMNAWGLTLTPDGRYAVVSNDDAEQSSARSSVDPQVLGGYALTVVDTSTLRIADRFAAPGETYFAGVSAIADPRDPTRTLIFAAGGQSDCVYVLDLDANGHLKPDAQHVIPIPGPLGAGFGTLDHSVPGALVASPDGRRVYAVDAGDGRVTALDTALRTVAGASVPVGFSPFGAALAGDRLLVTNEGLMRYAHVAAAALVPPFLVPPPDPLRASSLSSIGLGADGDFAPAAGDPPAPRALAMDVSPDGLRIVGGAHPTAIAVTPDAAYAFVAMTNVDRIATVRLRGTPLVVGGTELRLFDRGPYGTQPVALALSQDGTRLYVALAGLNAIAVLDARDPLHLHRLGLIPTGWLPSGVALSRDNRTLFVLNTKGFGHDIGATGDPPTGAGSNPVWSTLQKIDLGGVTLSTTTFKALSNTRRTGTRRPMYPHALRDVVVILEENTTFDAVLGDFGLGPADASYVRFGAAITPNLHALARRYALAGNIFADADESDVAHEFVAGGIATAYAERAPAGGAGGASEPDRRREDPEDYPRAGLVYHNLARHHVSFRDYGDWVRLSGYDEGEATDPKVDDPDFAGTDDRTATTRGLGGRYASDVPAPAILAGHVDLNYPGWNLRIRDERRAREFIRDYSALVAAHRQPRYTNIWLPAGHTGTGPDLPPVSEQVADGDRALGAIVAYLTHLRSWKNTVIFVVSDDAQGARDHVDDNRTFAVVISPFAKRRYIGMQHLSTVSVLKTSEEILGAPPVSLGDLVATDMSDFFTKQPDARPFSAIDVPVQTADPLPEPWTERRSSSPNPTLPGE